MKFLKKISMVILLVTILQTSKSIVADAYTNEQQAQISLFKNEYQKLDQTVYNYQNIYNQIPNFTSNSLIGSNSRSYQQNYDQAYKFVRLLFGLYPVVQNQDDNKTSLTGAYDMAAVPRNDGSNVQHGLSNLPKPSYVNDETWRKGITATRFGNIANIVPQNFSNYAKQTVMDDILDFVVDNNNYDPKSVGHRSWMLSQALNRYGIGTLYTNPQSSQTIINQGSQHLAVGYQVFYWGEGFSDEYHVPLIEPLTYPANNVFPLEFLNSSNPLKPVYWSIAFNEAQNIIPGHKPQIKLTNLKTHQITNILPNDISYESQYGGYNTVFTYLPRGINLKVDEPYQIDFSQLNLKSMVNNQKIDNYSYKVNFFNLSESINNHFDYSNEGKIVYINYLPNYGVRIYQRPGENPSNIFALHGTSWKISRQYHDIKGKIWSDLGNNQWISNDYLTNEINGRIPVGTVKYIKGYGINLWQGYGPSRIFTGRRLQDQTKWKVFKKAIVNNTYWFNLGGNLWVEGKYMLVVP